MKWSFVFLSLLAVQVLCFNKEDFARDLQRLERDLKEGIVSRSSFAQTLAENGPTQTVEQCLASAGTDRTRIKSARFAAAEQTVVPLNKCKSMPDYIMAYRAILIEFCSNLGRRENSRVMNLKATGPTNVSECPFILKYQFQFKEGLSDLQGSLVEDEVDKTLFLIFRASDNIRDWFQNLMIAQTDCRLQGASCGKVHSGFFNLFNRIESREGIIARVNAYSSRGWKIVVAGHSLGGALATIAGLALAVNNPKITVITYGSPRVGDETFANTFNRLVMKSERHVTETTCADGKKLMDLVPQVPVQNSDVVDGRDSVALAVDDKGIGEWWDGVVRKAKNAAATGARTVATWATGSIWKYKHVKGLSESTIHPMNMTPPPDCKGASWISDGITLHNAYRLAVIDEDLNKLILGGEALADGVNLRDLTGPAATGGVTLE